MRFLFQNTGSAPISGVVTTGLTLFIGSTTQPALLANATGSAPLGCHPYAGFQVVNVPLVTPLQPGETVEVQYEIRPPPSSLPPVFVPFVLLRQ